MMKTGWRLAQNQNHNIPFINHAWNYEKIQENGAQENDVGGNKKSGYTAPVARVVPTRLISMLFGSKVLQLDPIIDEDLFRCVYASLWEFVRPSVRP